MVFVQSTPCSSCFFDSVSKSRRKAATLNYVPWGVGLVLSFFVVLPEKPVS